MKILITTQLDKVTEKLLDEKDIYYHSKLAKEHNVLQKYLLTYTPDCLVVGANPVVAEDLKTWRNACPKQKLFVIRRGTGLSAIDQIAAKMHKVRIYNTPDVNSPYVAQYILANLLPQKQDASKKITLIGAGSIHSRVAKKILMQNLQIVIYAPSLQNDEKKRERWMKDVGVVSYKNKIIFASSLNNALNNADYLSIAIPLRGSGMNKTKHLLTNISIKKLAKNATVVSICEPDIFTADALLELYRRNDITVLLDNAKPLLEKAWGNITTQLNIPINSPIREKFTLQSQAMQMPGCAEDMDEAVLLKIATLELEQLEINKALKQVTDVNKKIVIVGAGISGMIQAVVLCERGYHDITVVDAYNYAEENISEDVGITFAGEDCRHVSLTETTPHADKMREKVLTLQPFQGGWQLRPSETLSTTELHWIQAFEQFTQKSGLHTLAKEFIITLNKKGLDIWEFLLERNPELLGGMQRKYPVLRIFLSEESLQNGWITQKKVNKNARFIDNTMLLQTQKYLQSAIAKNYVAGGVSVDGFGLNVHVVMKKLLQLAQSKGVKFLWNTKIVTIEEDKSKVKKIVTETGKRVFGDFFIFSTGSNSFGLLQSTKIDEKINNVIGCWLTIPNPGLMGPLKIHADEPAGVINCIVAANPEYIHVSGGFGYMGKTKASIRDKQVIALFEQVEQVIQRLFPKEYRKAKEDDSFDRKICARPMTPDGIPILDTINTYENALFVGGTNAGGTVEAPILGLLATSLDNTAYIHTKIILKTSRYSL
ncbi:MAG TPA: FAD-binding oxidoreductase [Candidatus Saccharimonadales bacterium]|nr:FAD-binding oxidoreductase [Candidatus Saccharimonadales bacterium]